jgi:hypothetical protein
MKSRRIFFLALPNVGQAKNKNNFATQCPARGFPRGRATRVKFPRNRRKIFPIGCLLVSFAGLAIPLRERLMPAIVNAHTVATDKAPKTDAPKTCTVSHAEFCRNATPLMATVQGAQLVGKPMEFSTGSLGWYFSGSKAEVKLANGQTVRCQVDLKLVVVNSKFADRTEPETTDDVA